MRYVGEVTGRGLVEGRDGVYDGAPFVLSTIGFVVLACGLGSRGTRTQVVQAPLQGPTTV
jgi:hypothetical protein